MRRKYTWTNNQLDKLNKVQEILKELENYKPLTLRQVYYQLVGKGFIENTVSQYTMLSNLLKNARLENLIDWDDMEDRGRIFNDFRGFPNKENFIEHETKNFLTGYSRNLLQSQCNHIEIWIEKDALSTIFSKVAINYNVPVVVCRGFSSVSFLNDFRNRAEHYAEINKNIVMLYFGDFDPSGVEMLEAMKITLQTEMNVNNIVFKRIALEKDDIYKYSLPHDPTALKKTDTRAKKFIEKYGNYAVELDALNPGILEQKIKTSIENEIDIDLFNSEIRQHNIEIDKLNKLKQSVINFMQI